MRHLDTEVESSKGDQSTIQAREEILRLAQSQRATLARTFEDLLGDGGPTEETADEMTRAIREWRDTPSNRSLD